MNYDFTGRWYWRMLYYVAFFVGIIIGFKSCATVANAQETTNKNWLEPCCYIAYQHNVIPFTDEAKETNCDVTVFNGCHFEIPFFTFGIQWWGANGINAKIVETGVNLPVKYVRPTAGVAIFGLDKTSETSKNWYIDFSNTPKVGFSGGITSAIPNSPVQVGITFKTLPDDVFLDVKNNLSLVLM